ncbi:hypothetical protein [Streptomyces sp. SPB78]|uniref:hypothetical protein n=1 Tax=Streptomyces sp. (strain SPB78) TaxID=591157 RepID=UPI0001B5698D|nr:hypothetical protein [Streptomyces sp. SPB78]
MTTVTLDVRVRVGDEPERRIATAEADTVAEAVLQVATALRTAGEALQAAAETLPAPAPEPPHAPRGTLYDPSNEAAREAWPTPAPPAPGG